MASHGSSSLAADVDKLDLRKDASHTKSLDQPSIPDFDRVIKNHHRALNITDEFSAACSSLEVGELIKDEMFTLFESVQALEIMDPKMDNGYLMPGETLYDYYDITADLSPEQVVGVMDQLLCYEMSWHQGYPLAQNLFTSQHIDNLLSQETPPHGAPHFIDLNGQGKEAAPLVQLVLRSFCIGTIKNCQQVMDVVWAQQYYEDEDFSTFTFNRDMLSSMPDSECVDLIHEAVEWVTDHLGEMHTQTSKALVSRLSLRARSLGLKDLCQAHRVDWDRIKIALQTVRETHSLGQPVKEAFSAKIQRKLANTTAPRPIVDLDFESACQQLGDMYAGIEEATKIIQPVMKTDPQSILSFIWQYSARTPSPYTFPRAMLQTFLFSDSGVLGMENIASFLVEELRSVLPDNVLDVSHWHVEVPTSSRFTVARHIDYFIDRAAPVWMNVFRCLCQNRCRMRRCLTNVLVELIALRSDLRAKRRAICECVSAEHEKENLDYSFLLVEYAVEQLRYKTMSWVLLFGFEQELYQPWEFASIYCCLEEVNNKNSCDLGVLHKYHADLFENGERKWSVSMATPLSSESSWVKVALLMARIQSDEIIYNLSTAFSLIYMVLMRLDRSNLFLRRGNDPFEGCALQLEARLKCFTTYPLTAENPSSYSTRGESGADNVIGSKDEEQGEEESEGEGLTLSPSIVEKLIARGTADYGASLRTCTKLLANVKRRIKFQTDVLFGHRTHPPSSNNDDEQLSMEQETLRRALGVTPKDSWWRDELHATLRATIKSSMLVSKLSKAYAVCNGDMDELSNQVVSMRMPPLDKRDHKWWILPDIAWLVGH